ncbi:hypothetical protein RF656_00635 [Yersinia kristensenii]|uniref:hypothetical protein n=1 Tax=Yersinia kristensenii TaxID=28152 RepID=UPI00285332FB|nr:hypothetical protein [Yersinia kristensenii]MDR4895257.1 hypothetical protein [Yersinia kristensenii]MDX6737815.1 hypothetical protein [Yersinia kristensenii]
MATHINTTNAIKGLTCAVTHFNALGKAFGVDIVTQHPIQHLTNAATEIERLNNENFKLRNEIAKLERGPLPPVIRRWEKVIDAVSATAAGETVSYLGIFDPDMETDRAIAAIKKTEADRKEALRTAEAFQKAQPKAEPTEDIFTTARREIFTNYFPAPDVLSALTNRRAGFLIRGRYRFILTEIIDEAVRASEIHPKWPTDALHAVSILTEESGELMKAAIEYHYNNGDIEAVREEAVQTGAMALRVLLNIDKYKRPSDEK